MNFNKYIPDRKIWAGGLTGVVAYVLVEVGKGYGFELTPDVATALVTGLTIVVSYLTPPSVDDIVKRVDDNIKMILR